MSKTYSGCVCKDSCKFFSDTPDKAPEKCPGKIHTDIIEQAKKIYNSEDTDARRLWKAFGRLIGTGGAQKSRFEHLIDFCHSMNIEKIGIASCLRYIQDAHYLKKVIMKQGFQCHIVFCKVGGLQTKDLGINKETDWIVCNPLAQALILNNYGCEVDVTLGLCMGHEMIFNKYATGYITNLYVKEKISREKPRDTIEKMMNFEYECNFHEFG